ncbi:MAG: hypothetical protein PHP42_02235 [Bacteroidota bacterium]|nr:hypothetical protein [Bacteroidota bacterium]
MATYDIGLAWNWEFDYHFIHGIEHECHAIGVTTYRIDPYNIEEVIKAVKSGKLIFRTFLDRASDDEEAFIPLAKLIAKSNTQIFNPYEWTEYAKDKSNMHLALLGEGVHIPYTIIISPYSKKKEVELSLTELAHLGRPFIIKPANTTGGGIGVVLGAETLKQIIESRKHHKNDTYLLQETVQPIILDGKKAWFRVFYAFGTTIACWWDHETHVYKEMSPYEIKKFKLKKLHEIVLTLHRICKLDFFSSEITLTSEGKFIAVDYVNEICDMREQSRHVDGVPNHVIHVVQKRLAQRVKSLCKKLA